MTAHSHDIAPILTLLHEAFARRDMDTIGRYFDEDIRFVNPDGEMLGKAARMADEERIFYIIDDGTIEVTSTVIEGNQAVELSILHGIAKIGANSGSPVALRYVVHYQFDGDQIVFQEVCFDRVALATQLGLSA